MCVCVCDMCVCDVCACVSHHTSGYLPQSISCNVTLHHQKDSHTHYLHFYTNKQMKDDQPLLPRGLISILFIARNSTSKHTPIEIAAEYSVNMFQQHTQLYTLQKFLINPAIG